MRKLGMMFGEIIFDVLKVFRCSARPADPHHGWNIRLTRASISSSSMNSPRSACSMPFRTPDRKRASSSSSRSAASFTSSAGSTPSCVAILARRASSSGVNRTSMILQTRRARSPCQAGEEFSFSSAAAPSSKPANSSAALAPANSSAAKPTPASNASPANRGE